MNKAWLWCTQILDKVQEFSAGKRKQQIIFAVIPLVRSAALQSLQSC